MNPCTLYCAVKTYNHYGRFHWVQAQNQDAFCQMTVPIMFLNEKWWLRRQQWWPEEKRRITLSDLYINGKQEGKKGKNMKLYDWPVRLRISVLNHNTVTVEIRVASQCKCYSAANKSTARSKRYLTDQNTKNQTHRPIARKTINLLINHRSTNWMSKERWCGRNPNPNPF